MRKLKRWGLIGLLVLVGLEILTIAPRRLSGPETPQSPEQGASPAKKSAVQTVSQVMQGIHLVETTRGKREWELDAKSAEGFKDKGTWQLKGVLVKFFGSNNTYTVTGDSGKIKTEIKDMEIFGNVVMRTADGYSLKTNSLKYDARKKLLNTPDEVEVNGPNKEGEFKISGKGFNADINTNIMMLQEKVMAVKSVPPERIMTIKSVWSRINGRTNEAHFEDQVQVDIDNIRMTGNQADFVYESRTRALKSLRMLGNVKVTDQKYWASAQKAKILFAEEEFILLGNPRVVQDENELRGQEIRLLKGGKEIRVSKARARVERDTEELIKERKR